VFPFRRKNGANRRDARDLEDLRTRWARYPTNLKLVEFGVLRLDEFGAVDRKRLVQNFS
jgi:hypothetical protein